jgi:hypothetical protein
MTIPQPIPFFPATSDFPSGTDTPRDLPATSSPPHSRIWANLSRPTFRCEPIAVAQKARC